MADGAEPTQDGANKHGLSRTIPAEIQREVRRRSKFGCVVCRAGFYQYEHIDPPFEEAQSHDPEAICCLCGSCHDAVTRGRLSKSLVKTQYEGIQKARPEDVKPPSGPLDFHDGTASLLIGGIYYSPMVQTLLRYHGEDWIRLFPGQNGEPGAINAKFTDDMGRVTLELVENVWVGSLEAWDIESKGPRITVRRKKGSIALQLRLDPPGRIAVERLDMRIRDAHILATEKAWAAGIYETDQVVKWVSGLVQIDRSTPVGAAIEYCDPSELARRDLTYGLRPDLNEMATKNREVVLNAGVGIIFKHLGISIASLCGGFTLGLLATGSQRLVRVRKAVLKGPDEAARSVSSGTGTIRALWDCRNPPSPGN